MISKNTRHEIIRFALVGILATAIHYLVYWIAKRWINVNIAYTLGYAVSFIANYFMTAYFTFKKKTSIRNGAGFMLAHICNYLLQIALLNMFLWFGVNEDIVPLPVYCIAVPVNFVLVRTVFNKLK